MSRIALLTVGTFLVPLLLHAQEEIQLPWPVAEALRMEARSPGVLRMPELEGVERALKRQHPSFPTFADSAVHGWIERWTTLERDAFRGMLALWKEQRPFMAAQLLAADLPLELALLPFALSGMDPLHRNLRGAGIWALPHAVAVKHGVRINDHYDGRHQLVLSTFAATKHLSEVARTFTTPDMQALAMACGPANAVRAKQRCDGETSLSALYHYVDPMERSIVPRWMAALYLVDQEAALDMQPLVLAPLPPTDTCRTSRPLQRSDLVRSLMITPALFAWLAPTSVGRTVPTGIQLILPAGLCERLKVITDSLNSAMISAPQASTPLEAEAEERTPDGRETLYHRVVAGDVLGRIAERYGVTLDELRRWNEIKGDRIDVGDILTLHGSPALNSRDVEHRTSANGAGDEYTWYTVRRGDSLYAIAKRHVGLSAESLMRYNKIGPDIRPGQRIKIPSR